MTWSAGEGTRKVGFRTQAGVGLLGEQVASIEGDSRHNWGIFLGCSFTRGERRVLVAPGLPIAFHVAHMSHLTNLCHLVSLYQRNRAPIFSFLCPRLFHLHLSPSWHVGDTEFWSYFITRKQPHLLMIVNRPTCIEPALILCEFPGAVGMNHYLPLLEMLSLLGCR